MLAVLSVLVLLASALADLSLYRTHDTHTLWYNDTSWNLPAASIITSVANGTIINAGWWDYDDEAFHGPLVFNSSHAYRVANTWGLQEWYWDLLWPQRLAQPTSFHVSGHVRAGQCQTVCRSLADSPVGPRNGRAVYLTLLNLWNEQFQHICFDTLPLLSFVCPFLDTHPEVLVAVHNELQAELVRLYCPHLDPARFQTLLFNHALHAAHILVPHFQGLDGALLYNGMVPPRSMRSLGPQTRRGSQVIYFGRHSSSPRAVENEHEVLAILRSRFADALIVVSPSDDWKVLSSSQDTRRRSKRGLLLQHLITSH